MTPVNTPVPKAMTSPNLISSHASFDFGHGFDLHCVLYGRLGSGVPGYTRIFGGKMGYLGWMGFLGELRQTRCVVSDDGTRRSFFLFDNDLNLMGRKYKHSY